VLNLRALFSKQKKEGFVEAEQNWFNPPEVENKRKVSEGQILQKLLAYATSDTKLEVPDVSKDCFIVWPTIHTPPRITSKYGKRTLNINGKRRVNFHSGIDFGTAEEVIAVEDMVIQEILLPDFKYPCRFKWSRGTWVPAAPKGRAWTPFVKAVGIFTKNLYVYRHVNAIEGLAVGQRIKAGNTIGTAGNLGYSMGSHLHFEIWPKDPEVKELSWLKPVDPFPFLNARVKLEERMFV